ncbi:hypothetical protein [Legionella tucsonensis]|uniref:Coiled-coil protein n=1 Tax=Legionella tucsonensis TaxID=40335 RepID=A0A0W0ZTD3_9GAMM|nr:hypothetical protein [Legionella tucsonensis]KTD72443.1 coiled-coil protein [Legionella tucsonensis]
MDDNLQKMLNEMIENKELKPNTPNKLKNLFKLLPFSNSFFNLVDKTGIPMSQIVAGTASSAGQMQRAMKSANVAKGLTFAQPLFAGIDLLLLPVAFFLYFDKHDKKYYTLSNAAKFAYSAATLSLITLSIFFPPVAVITAGLGFVGAVVAVGNHLFKLNRVSKQLNAVTKEIKELNCELEELSVKAETLMKKPNPDPQQIKELYKEFKEKQSNKQNKIDHQESLILQNKQLSKKRGLIDKLFGVTAAGIALSGILIATVFPPVGLLILVGVAATSVVYMGGRFFQEVGGAFLSKIIQKFKKNDGELNQMDNTTELNNSKDNSVKAEHQASPIQGSTLNINKLMSPDAHLEAITNQQNKAQELEKKYANAEKLIKKIKKPDNLESMQSCSIKLLCAIGEHINKGAYRKEEIMQFLNEIPEFEEIKPSLKEVVKSIAKGDILITEAQMSLIKEIPKASAIIEEYHEKSKKMDKEEILSEVEHFLDIAD